MVRIFAARVVSEPHRDGLALLELSFFRCFPGESEFPAIARTDLGKPFFSARSDLHFNLSHSGDWVVCALSDRPVGVDLQKERPLRASVFRRFTQEEQEFLRTGQEHTFFGLWAKKEARLKAGGEGLTIPLNSFSVLPLPCCQIGDWIDRLLPFPDAGYHLAVCYQGESEDLALETVNFS